MRKPTRGRIALRAALVFLGAFIPLIAVAGSILAVRLDLGHYWYSTSGPYMWGTKPSGTATYSGTFVRAIDGVHLGGPHASEPPAGTLLGSADFNTRTTWIGFPRPYYSEWTISVTQINPSPEGPAATDVRAWIAIVSEAISRARWGRPAIPDALKRGESSGAEFSTSSFAFNAAWRLLHDPVWPSIAFVLAAGLAVGACWKPIRQLRRGPGACAACGYDRQGLPPDAKCPECGAPAAA
jgi:hypothetical protein